MRLKQMFKNMTKEDKHKETEQKIIDAARKLFIKKGFKATTVRNIATLSGTNVAMVNYYFHSKENLFNSIFEESFSILLQKIFLLIDSDLPFFELNELAKNPDKFGETFKLKTPYQLYAKLAIRINEEEKKGSIRTLPLSNFFLNVISLSIFPFLAKPVVTQFLSLPEKDYTEMLDNHREFVTDFIIRAIKKDE